MVARVIVVEGIVIHNLGVVETLIVWHTTYQPLLEYRESQYSN